MKNFKLLLVEPPKDYWFLMGEYLPPPTPLLTLAAYVEREIPDIEIEVVDCQAERKNWDDLRRYFEKSNPSMVAASGFTCNTYVCARTMEMAKHVDPNIITVVGGQHFSSTPEETLSDFPEIDFVVRGEGEVTLVELIKAFGHGKPLVEVKGLSFRHKTGRIVHTPTRPVLKNLDELPFPAYHLVEKNIGKYHFTMMAGRKNRYLILEGSRGCNHRCSFCTQWRHWNGIWRTKTPRRIADEMEHLYETFDGTFLWFTDDNFEYRKRAEKLYDELKKRRFIDDVNWFFQARTDDIAAHPDLVSKLREVGNNWVLIGVENNSPQLLKDFNKKIKVSEAYQAVKILNRNNVFAQSMFIIGSRKDTKESIEELRRFSLDLGTDLAIYTVLTPFPGTKTYEDALRNNWIEDTNLAHYDMAHAIMPTETLSREMVQEELYECYRRFYGSISRNLAGIFSKNPIKRRAYRHMAGKNVLRKLRRMI